MCLARQWRLRRNCYDVHFADGQTIPDRARREMNERETLYRHFITEAWHLIADGLDQSLDKQILRFAS